MNEPTSLIHNIRLTEKASLLGKRITNTFFGSTLAPISCRSSRQSRSFLGRKLFVSTLPNTPGKRNGNAEPISAGARIGRRRSSRSLKGRR